MAWKKCNTIPSFLASRVPWASCPRSSGIVLLDCLSSDQSRWPPKVYKSWSVLFKEFLFVSLTLFPTSLRQIQSIDKERKNFSLFLASYTKKINTPPPFFLLPKNVCYKLLLGYVSLFLLSIHKNILKFDYFIVLNYCFQYTVFF